LVHHYLAWFVLFNFMLHWLIITGHGFFVWLPASLVIPYWTWLVLFQFILHWFFFFWAWYLLFHFPHWFIITWHDFYCFTSLIGSSLLGMVCFLSLHVSLVHHHWTWFVWLDYELHWFFY
jgi:hypothetical protein